MKLLLWILRLPLNKPEICKSKGLLPNFIEKLEKSTSEVMANIKESRRPVLIEIYKVAKKEEALRNGEICKLSHVFPPVRSNSFPLFFSSPRHVRRDQTF